jgi:cytochrome d ubiquinol oxidase subunit II
MLEGFDFGVGMLLPFLPRSEQEADAMFESIGPVWDGNETWLVVAGGATFAAFPTWYATMFSGFYIALLLVLVFLIIRVVSFEWRERSHDPRWRTVWLWANTVGSFGASLIWGVGLSSLLNGVPINSNGDFAGSFWDLFTWYTLLAGVAVVAVFATVVVAVQNNDKSVWPPVLPAALGGCALVLALVLVGRRSGLAFAMTAAATVLIVATLFTSLYPRVMVSDPTFGNSLTVSSASSAHYTLAVMTVVAVLVAPVVLLYQAWTYHVVRHRLDLPEA